MIPSALNTLFGVPASRPATTRPESNPAAFGDMLSREINGRQNGARTAPQSPRPDNPSPANRAAQSNAAPAPKSPERQNPDRQQVNGPQNQQADATPSGKPAQANTAEPQTPSTAAPVDGADKSAKTSKKDKSDKATDSDPTAADTGVASAASAELLALVASLSPKLTATTDPATATAAAATAGTIDPNAATAKGAAVRLGGNPGATDAEPAATDPAFDALLAQAAQIAHSSAARGRSKAEAGVGAAKATGSDTVPTVRADADRTSTLISADTGAVRSARPDEIGLTVTAIQGATGKADPAALAGMPIQAGAIPSALTQAASGAAPDTLTPHVGTPAWDHALGQKVVWMAAGAQQSASLTLNPPDLGPIQIVINVSNAQADASFIAAQPEVRQALEAALPRLKEMLGEAGITLGQASVNAGNPNQNQNGAAQQQAGNGAIRGTGASRGERLDNEPVGRPTTRAISGGVGLVDTFA